VAENLNPESWNSVGLRAEGVRYLFTECLRVAAQARLPPRVERSLQRADMATSRTPLLSPLPQREGQRNVKLGRASLKSHRFCPAPWATAIGSRPPLLAFRRTVSR